MAVFLPGCLGNGFAVSRAAGRKAPSLQSPYLGLSLSPVPPMPPVLGARRDKGICSPVAEDVQTLVTFEAMGWSFALGEMLPLLLARIYWCVHTFYWCVHTFPPRGSSCSFQKQKQV